MPYRVVHGSSPTAHAARGAVNSLGNIQGFLGEQQRQEDSALLAQTQRRLADARIGVMESDIDYRDAQMRRIERIDRDEQRMRQTQEGVNAMVNAATLDDLLNDPANADVLSLIRRNDPDGAVYDSLVRQDPAYVSQVFGAIRDAKGLRSMQGSVMATIDSMLEGPINPATGQPEPIPGMTADAPEVQYLRERIRTASTQDEVVRLFDAFRQDVAGRYAMAQAQESRMQTAMQMRPMVDQVARQYPHIPAAGFMAANVASMLDAYAANPQADLSDYAEINRQIRDMFDAIQEYQQQEFDRYNSGASSSISPIGGYPGTPGGGGSPAASRQQPAPAPGQSRQAISAIINQPPEVSNEQQQLATTIVNSSITDDAEVPAEAWADLYAAVHYELFGGDSSQKWSKVKRELQREYGIPRSAINAIDQKIKDRQ
jgi:hypothetical protein